MRTVFFSSPHAFFLLGEVGAIIWFLSRLWRSRPKLWGKCKAEERDVLDVKDVLQLLEKKKCVTGNWVKCAFASPSEHARHQNLRFQASPLSWFGSFALITEHWNWTSKDTIRFHHSFVVREFALIPESSNWTFKDTKRISPSEFLSHVLARKKKSSGWLCAIKKGFVFPFTFNDFTQPSKNSSSWHQRKTPRKVRQTTCSL